MIVKVDESSLNTAAKIHSASWTESHRSFCTKEFLAEHDEAHQTILIKNEISSGTEFFMLIKENPVGVVSIKENLIENLYILPEQQRKGFGTELLFFAIERCKGTPVLWILGNNKAAFNLYTKYGFKLTGKRNDLSDTVYEVEMSR